MEELKNLKFDIWHTVSEEFLYEKFINDEPTKKNEKTNVVEIDPEKIHFVETTFDRYYYKEKSQHLMTNSVRFLKSAALTNKRRTKRRTKRRKNQQSNVAVVLFIFLLIKHMTRTNKSLLYRKCLKLTNEPEVYKSLYKKTKTEFWVCEYRKFIKIYIEKRMLIKISLACLPREICFKVLEFLHLNNLEN